MKHLHLTQGFLREQRARIDTSIELLEALVGAAGGNGNGVASGNGHRGALKVAADALALHEAQIVRGSATLRPASRKQKPGGNRGRGVMGPLPEVKVPDGLTVRGLPLREAIPAALRGARKALDSKHLAALLLAAGFEWDSRQPFTTAIGTWCGGHGRIAGIKGDREGWRLR